MAGWSAVGGQCRSAYVTDNPNISDGILGHSVREKVTSHGCLVVPRLLRISQQSLSIYSHRQAHPLAVPLGSALAMPLWPSERTHAAR